MNRFTLTPPTTGTLPAAGRGMGAICVKTVQTKGLE